MKLLLQVLRTISTKGDENMEEKLKQGQKEASRQMKPLDDMDVIDNFLFTEMAYGWMLS